MATASPLAGPSALRDVIHPQFHQNNFPAEVHIKVELGVKLDKGIRSSLTHFISYSNTLPRRANMSPSFDACRVPVGAPSLPFATHNAFRFELSTAKAASNPSKRERAFVYCMQTLVAGIVQEGWCLRVFTWIQPEKNARMLVVCQVWLLLCGWRVLIRPSEGAPSGMSRL